MKKLCEMLVNPLYFQDLRAFFIACPYFLLIYRKTDFYLFLLISPVFACLHWVKNWGKLWST